MIYKSLSQTTGNTPLLELNGYSARFSLTAKIFAKLEYLNPTGSASDRSVKFMLDYAVRSGKLKSGTTLVEPTYGNTGVSLSAFAAPLGCKVIAVMPEDCPQAKAARIRQYGGAVELTAAASGMRGAIERTKILLKERGGFALNQFTDSANPAAHRLTTGPEIWYGTSGNVDILVAGVGTGGTLAGTGAYLKSVNPRIKIIAAEAYDCPIAGRTASHKIQGIGAGFFPPLLKGVNFDEASAVRYEEAVFACGEVARTEGISAGLSSGAALWAATRLACNPENFGKSIVVIFPDGG